MVGGTGWLLPGGPGGGASAIDDLSDVDTSTMPPTNGQALAYDSASGLWKPATIAPGGAGALLAVTAYNPAVDGSKSSMSATFADVHASATATFTVPASGTVLVRSSAGAIVDSGTPLEVNLRDGAGDISGTGQRVLYSATSGAQARFTHTTQLSGLTADASKTVKLGLRRASGAGSAVVAWGGIWGALMMEVWSA